MAVTMNEVATLAGVSIKTVSNVVNGYPYIRSETKERVESAIRSLDYRVNVSARNLRAGRSRTITLAVPELTQPYFAELAQAVIDEAAAVDLTVFVETTGGRPERELAIATGVQPILSDGLIFSPQGMTPDAASAIRPGVPMVLLGERVFHSPFDHVTMANEAAAQAAVSHLLELGRRRVLLLGSLDAEGGDVSTGSLRMRGALRAFAEHGVSADRNLMSYQEAWDRPHGERAVSELLANGTRFDAVFGMNDAIALGALRGLLHAGIDVPGDVAVVGFDDTLDAKYSTPSLTSISPGRSEIARIAIELLKARLDGAEIEHDSHVELSAPFELMKRESTLGRM